MKRSSYLSLFLIFGTLWITGWSVAYVWWNDDLRPVREIIQRGEQGWGDVASRELRRLEGDSRDPNELAERLIKEPTGSLVVEGLLMMERHNHPDLRSHLERFEDDERWAWTLQNVSDTVAEIRNRHGWDRDFE